MAYTLEERQGVAVMFIEVKNTTRLFAVAAVLAEESSWARNATG